MADGQPKVCTDAAPEIMLKILDNAIQNYEREIDQEREEGADTQQQPKDGSSGTVDIQPPENQDSESETSSEELIEDIPEEV